MLVVRDGSWCGTHTVSPTTFSGDSLTATCSPNGNILQIVTRAMGNNPLQHAPMTTPRSQLVDADVPMYYHLISRCVRRSWLCGRDSHTGRNFNHRKDWLRNRLFHLARYFSVQIDAYAIMSNHFHLVVYYDPTASQTWSDEEVARRWCEAFPRNVVSCDAEGAALARLIQHEQILVHPEELARARRCLGSLSDFMKHLKQPIAWRANREDRCTGHFFEGRFYSGALLNDAAVLAAMAYVDLNPIRAKLAKTLEACRDSSVFQRLRRIENTPDKLREAIRPLVSGLEHIGLPFTLAVEEYVVHLRMLMTRPTQDAQERWFSHVAAIRKRQRAYGFSDWLHGSVSVGGNAKGLLSPDFRGIGGLDERFRPFQIVDRRLTIRSTISSGCWAV